MEGGSGGKNRVLSRPSTTKRLLEPFGHQVGGRCLMLVYDDRTICKKLVPQEYRFYRGVPAALQPFIPGFKGIVKIEFQRKDDGAVQAVASSPTCTDLSITDQVHFSQEDLDHHTSCKENISVAEEEHEKLGLSSSKPVPGEEKTRNPWSVHCQCLQLQKLQASKENSSLHDFILLENVVSKFSCPNILDLKMGNKTHNDYQCDKKQERQRARMDSSTSKSLGVRIAGMQLYEPMEKKFTYHDKKYGFQLSPEQFKQALMDFLQNVHKRRKDVTQSFICKLRDLHTCLSQQDSARFYSSSLLLSYDGLEDPNANLHNSAPGESTVESGLNLRSCGCDHKTKVEVRMIDFEHCFLGLSRKAREEKGPDKGYLFGLESLIDIFKEIQSNT